MFALAPIADTRRTGSNGPLCATGTLSELMSQPWSDGKEPNVETEMCAGGGHLPSVSEPRFGCTIGN
jgi:hypothetical protein